MTQFRIILYILVAFLFISCKVNSEEKVVKEINPSYEISYDSAIKYPYWRGGRSLSIDIKEKYNSEQLTYIADSIVVSDNNRHEIICVNFFYRSDPSNPLIEKEQCFLATSFYNNGNISTVFNHVTTDKKSGNEKEDIGYWREPVLNATISIYKLSGKYYLEYWYGYQAEYTREIEPNKKKGKNTYNIVGDENEFYVLKKNGLYLYNTHTNEYIAYYEGYLFE